MALHIGELLVKAGKLQPAQLEQVLRVQQDSNLRLGSLIVQLGMLAERDLADTLCQQLDLPLANEADYAAASEFTSDISKEFLQLHRAVPVRTTPQGIQVVVSDPSDTYLIEALQLALNNQILPLVGLSSDILAALEQQFTELDDISELDNTVISDLAGNFEDIEQLKDMASEAPVIRAVNQMIVRALEQRASDIHLEPADDRLKIRYRIDGVLREIEMPRVSAPAAIISRIKVMADLNIAERRLPQDGRIKVRVEGREVDMRISTIPTLHGESVVMRLLDQGGVPLDFQALGFEGKNLARLQKLLQHPQGILLVTGPTGSGKTTTLYTALQQLNSPSKKILTVEDPVEYQLDGINQIQVQPKIDLTFANALRSILRQDPDIIMIGEMRDTETARIAVQAALTGHKVLSTLHTNDACSSITRLLDMHVDDFLLSSTIDGVLAQRLVRRLCEHCKVAFQPDKALIEEHRLERLQSQSDTLQLFKPVGCRACEHTGFRGRTTISELLVMSEGIRNAIIQHGDADSIRQVAIAEGMSDMYQDGLGKALQGLTTLQEVVRVTQIAIQDH